MGIIMIKNTTDYAFRFNATTVLEPGTTTAVSSDVLEAYPAIKLLIKRGDLKVEEAKNEVEEEIVED